MSDRAVERIRRTTAITGLYVFTGILVAFFAEMATTGVTLYSLGRGASVWRSALPPVVPEVGEYGRLVFWTVTGAAGFRIAERATGVDVAGNEERRRRVYWFLVGAAMLGAVGVVVGVLWLLGLVG